MTISLKAGRQRELWIDCLKGIGILFVILGHSLPPFRKFINGFHMPLFFILSGYLWSMKNTTFKIILKNNAHRYVVPYFILCGINFMLFPVLPQPPQKYIFGILYSRGTTEWMPNCSPLWFLTAMFVAMMLLEVSFRTKITSLLIFIFGCVSSLLSIFDVFKLPWNVDTAMMAVVFMYAGQLLKRSGVICNNEQKPFLTGKQICILILLFTIGIVAIWFNPIESVNFDNNRYGNILLMFIGALSICCVIFYLCYRIPWKGAISWYLSWLGQHTIFIMGFDYLAGSIARLMLGKIRFENWLSVFVIKIVLLTIGCMFWIWIISKIKSEKVKRALSF